VKGCKHNIKVGKKRTDVCEVCWHWDRHLQGDLLKWFASTRASLCSVLPRYFDALAFNDSSPESPKFLAQLLVHLNRHCIFAHALRAELLVESNALLEVPCPYCCNLCFFVVRSSTPEPADIDCHTDVFGSRAFAHGGLCSYTHYS
jgi:hypothetical protein